MTTHSITTVYNNKMSFTSNINGHLVKTDTTAEDGGEDSGPSPKRLMLAALAGCTGIDVVSILNKMKVAFSDFSMYTEAHLTNEHPKIYDRVKLIYKIKLPDQDRPKMEKAVALSKDKYCGVSAMFTAFAKFTTEIEYLP